MNEIYEVTMKKIQSNELKVNRLTISFEGISRDEAMKRSMKISERLGLIFEMSYIIRGFKE